MNKFDNRSSYILKENLTPFIISYLEESWDHFWIASVVDVRVSKDHSYADFYVSSQYNEKELPKFLSRYAWELRSMIWREFWARKSPQVRFKVAKDSQWENDVLSLIDEMTKKYHLGD